MIIITFIFNNDIKPAQVDYLDTDKANINETIQTNYIATDETDFTIENGTLISYNGNDSEITIPLSITTIAENAFYGNKNVTSIIIPYSVTKIETDAFYGCSNLTEINTDKNNKKYKSLDGVLYNADMSELVLYPCCREGSKFVTPDSVKTIDSNAFGFNNKLKTIIISDSVTYIGKGAFFGETCLETIELSSNITEICDSTFTFCYALKEIIIPEGVISIGNSAFYFCTALVKVRIPDSVNKIDIAAFNECRSLTDIIIPDNVTLCEIAFYNCTSLVNVTLKDNVTVGINSFYNTPWAYLNLDDFDIDGSTLIGYYGDGSNVVIPEGVTDANSPFGDIISNKITSLTIPNSMTNKNNIIITCDELENLENIYVHDDNKNYTSVDGLLYTSDKKALVKFPKGRGGNIEIPNLVEKIGDYAFSTCTKIEDIIIPQNVKSIGLQVFINCTALKTVVLPNTISELVDTFQGCSNLTTIYYTGTEEQWDSISILEEVKMLSDLSISKINIIFNYKP